MDLYIDEEFVWGSPRIYPRRDSIPFGPLELAVKTGNEKIVTLLLNWGADPNRLHSMSLPPAILAIKHKRILKSIRGTGGAYNVLDGGAPMLEFFLAKGILKFPVRRDEREAIISYTVENKCLSSLKYLVDQNLDIPSQKVPELVAYLADAAGNAGAHSAMADEAFNNCSAVV